MTRAADLLSRSEIWQVISLNTIPVDQLELLAQKAAKEIFPKNFLVQPHMLYKLVTSELAPGYLTKVAARKVLLKDLKQKG